VNGIRMDFGKTGCGSVQWIHPAQDRDRWQAPTIVVMNLQVLMPQS
jgi:hypothetical protein